MKDNRMVKVAIAEDLAVFRDSCADMINTMDGFACIHLAENGKRLLDRIQGTGVVPDICLLDIKMPVMDGYATASALRDRWPEMRIIALSAHNEEYNVIRMVRSGANGYLSKAASKMEVYSALRSVMSCGSYYSDVLSGKLLSQLKAPGKDIGISLSDTELEFMSWACSDLSYRQIAANMNMTERALECLRDPLFARLGVNFRSGLVMFALSIGLCPRN